jgi:hypothetical protein
MRSGKGAMSKRYATIRIVSCTILVIEKKSYDFLPTLMDGQLSSTGSLLIIDFLAYGLFWISSVTLILTITSGQGTAQWKMA